MERRNFKILITGPPGCGKTTLVEAIIKEWKDRIRLAGFITREIREKGQRLGFELIGLNGKRSLLSHVNHKSQYRVGKYGVDVTGFENFLSSISLDSQEHELIIIDEIGKMECLSEKFRKMVLELLNGSKPLLATIAFSGTPFIEGVKSCPGKEIITLTPANREQVKENLNTRLKASFLKISSDFL